MITHETEAICMRARDWGLATVHDDRFVYRFTCDQRHVP
jgi:hypothetical protein